MNELKIQKELRKFAKKRDWVKFHNLKNLAISINLESSELLEIFQWENENSKFWLKKNTKNHIEEEIADVMLYILRFADIAEIDLEKACIEKIKKNKKSTQSNCLKEYLQNIINLKDRFKKALNEEK